jgi:hypothetical protein
MHAGKARVIFDTSGLNKMMRDPHQQALMESLGSACEVLISETSVTEISATRDAGKRRQLADVCEKLLPFGSCLMPHNWILEEMPRLHRRYKDRFRWEDVDITAPMIGQEILRREFLNQDKMAEESREDARKHNDMFVDIFEGARDKFGPQFPDGVKDLALSDFIGIYKAEAGPFWGTVAGWYERARLVRPDEAEAREFIQACPPFHAVAMGMVIAHYQYGIPRGCQKAGYDAGRNDLFMAVYLPYCDWFITDDSGQRNALRAIAEEVDIGLRIESYPGFCCELLGIGAERATA